MDGRYNVTIYATHTSSDSRWRYRTVLDKWLNRATINNMMIKSLFIWNSQKLDGTCFPSSLQEMMTIVVVFFCDWRLCKNDDSDDWWRHACMMTLGKKAVLYSDEIDSYTHRLSYNLASMAHDSLARTVIYLH